MIAHQRAVCQGCQHEVTHADRSAHYHRECPAVIVCCAHRHKGCMWTGRRDEFAEHFRNHCIYAEHAVRRKTVEIIRRGPSIYPPTSQMAELLRNVLYRGRLEGDLCPWSHYASAWSPLELFRHARALNIRLQREQAELLADCAVSRRIALLENRQYPCEFRVAYPAFSAPVRNLPEPFFRTTCALDPRHLSGQNARVRTFLASVRGRRGADGHCAAACDPAALLMTTTE
ncbi:unnamed protein product, partial [Amoebophrya sp. A120]|eukprot:GSA120T00013053001.1